jgi:hypothetical protein
VEKDFQIMIAMTTQDRQRNLEACFDAMRKDGCGLSLEQERMLRKAMEVL